MKIRVLLFLVCLCNVLHGQVTFDSVVAASGSGASSYVIAGNDGAADGYFTLSFATQSGKDVSSVTGGGLTWTEEIENDDTNLTHYKYTASGDPDADPFSITVTFAANSIICGNIGRHNGADIDGTPHSDEATHNNGTGTAPTITISATNFESGDYYVNGLSFVGASSSVTGVDANWTQRGTTTATGNARHALFDSNGNSDNVATHTISSSLPWQMDGGVINRVPVAGGRRRVIIIGD